MLLTTPKIVGQALRFPSSGRIDPSTITLGNSPVELRAGLSYSPIDAWRGHILGRVGDADCREHSAGQVIERLLLRETDQAQLGARRAQAAYLMARRPEWQGLLVKADAELQAGLLTLVELHELRRLTQELERKRVQAEMEVTRLEVQREAAPVAARDAISARGYLQEAGALEREVAALRSLDPWTFTLTGGVVPDQERVQWFGFAEVSYSLGGLFRGAAEERYMRARADELRQAPYELTGKLEFFRRMVAAEVQNSQRELLVIEAELADVGQTLARLEGVDARSGSQGRARLTIERISIEADAVLLRTQARELTLLVESLRDS
ncbi:MAG TPA: hypothetical protein VJU61_01095 [Polyangiaceae bacterium]|nr:hypothetical protein [Polyangiaceae bacterium]